MTFFYPTVDLETPCLYYPNRKPSLPLVPDRTNPLAKGLSAWLIPAEPHANWLSFSYNTYQTREGIGFEFNGFYHHIVTYSDPGSKEYSFFIFLNSLRRIGKLRTNCVFDKEDVFRFSWNDSTASGGVNCYTPQGVKNLQYRSLPAITPIKVGATMGYKGFALYEDGIVSRETTGVICNDHAAPIAYGNNERRTLRYWPGSIFVCYIWHRALSHAEHFSIAREPYQFLTLA